MRLCFISDCPSAETGAAETRNTIPVVLRELMTLAQIGYDISWLTSLSMWISAEDLPALLSPTDIAVPPTCRFVLPCQGYVLAGIRVIDIAAAIWQDAALHTRLFTFLRLFQKAIGCNLWHVWGTLPLVYLVLYTGWLVNIPVVVSAHTAMLQDTVQHPFLGEWVNKHLRHLAVMDATTSELSAPLHTFPPLPSHVVTWPIVPPISQALATMYASVTQSHTL